MQDILNKVTSFFEKFNKTRDEIDITQDCPICYDSLLSDKTICTPCNHTYHHKCLKIWLKDKNSCPYCTQSIVTPKIRQKCGHIVINENGPILKIIKSLNAIAILPELQNFTNLIIYVFKLDKKVIYNLDIIMENLELTVTNRNKYISKIFNLFYALTYNDEKIPFSERKKSIDNAYNFLHFLNLWPLIFYLIIPLNTTNIFEYLIIKLLICIDIFFIFYSYVLKNIDILTNFLLKRNVPPEIFLTLTVFQENNFPILTIIFLTLIFINCKVYNYFIFLRFFQLIFKHILNVCAIYNLFIMAVDNIANINMSPDVINVLGPLLGIIPNENPIIQQVNEIINNNQIIQQVNEVQDDNQIIQQVNEVQDDNPIIQQVNEVQGDNQIIQQVNEIIFDNQGDNPIIQQVIIMTTLK